MCSVAEWPAEGGGGHAARLVIRVKVGSGSSHRRRILRQNFAGFTPTEQRTRSFEPTQQRPSSRVLRNDLQDFRNGIERRCVLGKLETRVQIISTLSHRKESSLLAIFGKRGGRVRGNAPPPAPLFGIDHRNGFAQPFPQSYELANISLIRCCA